MIFAPIPLGITMVKKGKPALFLGGGGYAPKKYKWTYNHYNPYKYTKMNVFHWGEISPFVIGS